MLRLYNTLTKQVDEIHPIEPGKIKMYTCGPTVYRYAHIGNLRTYMMADWIRRALMVQGLDVYHVKNITDVGHMRQELVEAGGDKMIMAALAEGKTIQEIAQFYAESFYQDEERVNILPAHVFPWATNHIPEMVSMVEQLIANGYAYETGGNVYFDVPQFSKYGGLSRNFGGNLLEGVRVDADPLKRDPRDFTLWKAAEPGRDVKWDSPWGEGFPGWHIECSAMAHKYLGERFDIHTGGVDNVFPHHEDEIAQSEGAFGDPHVNYWVHAQHLLADGAKMAKSSGNVFLLDDLVSRGIDPLSFRYLCMTVRYRHRMNFTFNSLKASEKALSNLRNRVWEWKGLPELSQLPAEAEEWRNRFWEAVNNDLDLPTGLAITWGMVRSELPPQARLALLMDFDRLFGLDLDLVPSSYQLPETIVTTASQRTAMRDQVDYATADSLRGELASSGYVVQDTPQATRIRPKTPLEQQEERWDWVSSSREVESGLDSPDRYDFTFIVNAYNYVDDVRRCVTAIRDHAGAYSVEIIAIDNGSTDETADWLEGYRERDPDFRVVHCDHVIGDAAGKNIGVKLSRGRFIVIVDASTEITGDVLGTIAQQLSDESVGIFGPYGLTTDDMQHFHEEVEQGEADAMQAYCMAFRREAVRTVGLMHEGFRFYRNLDIDYCFQFKERGYRVLADSSLPMVRHEHRQWTELDDGQRDELSRKNFGRFLRRWGNRPDLLISSSARGFETGFRH